MEPGTDNGGKTEVRWERRGVIALVLIGIGTLLAKTRLTSGFHLYPANNGEYEVIAQWQIAGDGKGLMIATRPDSTLEELRALGKRLAKRFHGVNSAAVMVFDNATAAREVRKGSRNLDERQFQAALDHQRAMYRKSLPRGEDSFTIYQSYPVVGEIIRFDDDLRKTSK